MIRLYVEAELAKGAEVAPSAEQARYLTTVMRLSAGERLLLFNGRDGEWRALLAEVGKRGCRLIAEAPARPQAVTPDLELVVALVKRARLETIVEKATELGVRRIRLAITRRTNADHTNVARLQAIAVEAAEQTGRLEVPQVCTPEKLERLLEGWDEGRRLMFCDEGGEASAVLEALEGARTTAVASSETLPTVAPRDDEERWAAKSSELKKFRHGGERGAAERLEPRNDGWAILIGPEGGFSPEERTHLRSLPFVTPVSLGPRILRADTAAIAALTLWQAARGDWLTAS